MVLAVLSTVIIFPKKTAQGNRLSRMGRIRLAKLLGIDAAATASCETYYKSSTAYVNNIILNIMKHSDECNGGSSLSPRGYE